MIQYFKNMEIRSGLFFWSTLLIWLCSACQTPPEPAFEPCDDSDYTTHPKHAIYAGILNEYWLQNNLPGAVIAVQKAGEPLWIGATGKANLASGASMQTCTPFITASITKIFTATLIMQLKELNKIKLEDKLVDLLPEVKGRIPKVDQITVRQLLNHSSGLVHPSDDDQRYQLQILNNPEAMANMSIKQKLEKYVYDKPLVNHPGSGSHYSNAGYWLLQLWLEKETGKLLPDLMTEMLFKPLGMSQTYLNPKNNPGLARGYNWVGRKLTEVSSWDRADSNGDPAGGVISTAADLCLFAHALFSGNIITEASLAEMMETTKFPSCPNGDCGYGIGLETYHSKTESGYGKNGSLPGVDANLIYFPGQKATLVIFTNTGAGSRKDFMDELIK